MLVERPSLNPLWYAPLCKSGDRSCFSLKSIAFSRILLKWDLTIIGLISSGLQQLPF